MKDYSRFKKAQHVPLSENDLNELNILCLEVKNFIPVRPCLDRICSCGRYIYFALEQEYDYEVMEDDFDEENNFMTGLVLERVKYDIISGDIEKIFKPLGISNDAADIGFDSNTPIDIPNSSWKLLGDIDVELIGPEPEVTVDINTPEYFNASNEVWMPPESDFEFDEEAKILITYYLVKPI